MGYVIWSCSEEQYASIMNGTACPFYRHKHCNGVFCPDEAAVEAALAAEEITTELLAAEVVNTTTAGFTTGGLAETQDLSCGSDNSDDCVTEYQHGLEHFCFQCSHEGGSNPLRNRCHLCCTEC